MRSIQNYKSALVTLFLGASVFLSAQENLPQDYLTPEFHKGRREAARALMPPGSVMAIFAAPVRNYANDVDYFYHQNPDLYYFTGYKEPNAVLLLFKDIQKGADGTSYNEVFFVQKKDALEEQWTGRRLGVAGVKEKLQLNTVYNGSAFKNFPLDSASYTSMILSPLPDDVHNQRGDSADLFDLLAQFRTKTEPARKKWNTSLFREITSKLREIKTPEELVLIRKAVEISCIGQNEVMKTVRADMSEMEIQGLHEYVHKKYGAESVGYGSIIGSGENGCVLHYMENTKTRIGTEMLLMDVGAEYHGYTADVTRTIPADGKFSDTEKAIYQVVYDAQEAAFRLLKNGTRWADIENAAADVIAEGLLKLGIIQNKREARTYYPHGLSHHIGLNVHDKAFSPTMKTGMVITIEPGIYIPANSKCDKKWWGIAVRIEDDAYIRETDFELLSSFAPRSIEAIEKMISEKSPLDNFKLPALQSGQKKAF